MSRYRTKDDFQVTVSVPCPCCGQMADEKTIKARSRYEYGAGWLELTCCDPCWDQRRKEHQDKANKANAASRSSIFYPLATD